MLTPDERMLSEALHRLVEDAEPSELMLKKVQLGIARQRPRRPWVIIGAVAAALLVGIFIVAPRHGKPIESVGIVPPRSSTTTTSEPTTTMSVVTTEGTATTQSTNQQSPTTIAGATNPQAPGAVAPPAIAPTPTTTPPVTTTVTSSPPPSTTYAEQESVNHSVHTFQDHHLATGLGPDIQTAQWVQVSCKVYDPAIQSVNPDGYWYRIASSPWNNAYYSPANTFMNGDPPAGPYTHNTDFSVPDC